MADLSDVQMVGTSDAKRVLRMALPLDSIAVDMTACLMAAMRDCCLVAEKVDWLDG